MKRAVLLVCYGLLFAACAASSDTVVLMKSLNGGSGTVVVDGPTQAHILTAPGATVDINGAAMATRTSTAQEVQAVFRTAMPLPPPVLGYYVLFDTGEYMLSAAASAVLAALFADISGHPIVEVQITGHTDRVGSVESNDRLSKNRAVAVRDALILRGLKASLLRTVGRGEREPLVPTADDVEEKQNRRVEILVR